MSGDSILYELYPLRDNEEAVCGIIHRVFEYTEAGKIYQEIPYYFQKNLQGDVIAIVNKDAEVVARYSYDAWGKILSITDKDGNPISSLSAHIANINPYRYRGYYYDEETKLYYLQSRYYDARVGRFLNADNVLLTIAYTFDNRFVNLFTYSDNNFIVNYDPNGAFSVSVTAAAIVFDLIILAIILAVSYFASAKAAYKISRFSKWLRGKFDAAINKLAYWIADSIDTLFYNLLRHYNSIGKIRLAINAKYIANFISTLITLTPGAIIAELIDRFDNDGDNGRITY